MADKHPTPWRLELDEIGPEFTDCSIRDANDNPVVQTDAGCYPPDNETAALIVEAVNRFTHGENAPLPSARGAEPSSASRPTDAEPPPAVTAGETASMLLPWTVEGPFPGRKRTKKHDGFAPYANVVNRIGSYVAQGLPPEVAAGIVEAVNERDRLRDIIAENSHLRDLVGRLAQRLQMARLMGFGLPERDELLDEAKKALKEGNK